MRQALVTFGALLLAATAGAQTPPAGGAPSPQARFQALSARLSLTDEQQPRVRQILDEERTQLMASMRQEREQKTPVMEAHRHHQQIEDRAVAKLELVLNAQQLQKYRSIVAAEAKARHAAEAAASHRPPAGATPPAQ